MNSQGPSCLKDKIKDTNAQLPRKIITMHKILIEVMVHMETNITRTIRMHKKNLLRCHDQMDNGKLAPTMTIF